MLNGIGSQVGTAKHKRRDLDSHDELRWHVHLRLDKRHGDYTGEQIAAGVDETPYETLEREGNLLMTAGILAIWKSLRGDGVTPFSNANTRFGVGDGNTGAVATQTDLQATLASGKTITGTATSAGLINITAVGHGYTTGDTVTIAGVGGTTAANGTWVITVIDADHFTLNGSTYAGAYTSGGSAQKGNRYRLPMTGGFPKVGVADGLLDTQMQFQATAGSTEANFAWLEWMIFNGFVAASSTGLNRKVENLGTKTTGSWTLTIILSLS